MRFKAEKN